MGRRGRARPRAGAARRVRGRLTKPVTVHYRWHPLYGQMARVNRGLRRGHDELLFCELPDGTTGALPSWMTDALLDEYTDAQVAAVLNERGLRTGAGDAFDSGSVQWVRFAAGLTSFKERLIAAGMLTGAQIAAKLGVRRTTIRRWRRQGRLTARICNEMGEWLYAPPQDLSPHGTRPSERAAPGAKDRSLQEVRYEECSFAVEVLTCSRRGGPRGILGAVTEPHAGRQLLAALGLAAEPPPGVAVATAS